jgi:hypothetical protein
MRTSLIALSLALLGALAAPGLVAPAAAQGYYGGPSSYDAAPRARIWLDNGRDSFRRGERLRILFSTSDDAYVAVIHIDPDGNLDFLYPDSPLDRDYVRGGQTYSLPRGGFSRGELVRGNGGIGYLYIIASRAPLDYGYFRGRGYGWDWSYAGRGVHGDPFWALEQITRTLLPDNGYVPYTTDYASYCVEGRPWRYPTYACGGGYRGGRAGFGVSWGYNPYYDSCDRLDIFLRRNPYYFDPVRYRGDRRVVYRDYGPWQPNHGYKAAPDNPRQAVPRGSGQGPARSVAPQNGSTRASEPAQPARRPTLERRPDEPAPRSREPETRPVAPANRGVTRAAPDRSPAPDRATGRSGGSSPAPAPARATGKSGGSSPAPAQPARRRPGGD